MAKIIFTLGGDTFTFDVSRSHPVHDPKKVNVVTEMSEGGQLYAYDKGIEEQFFNLTFNNATATDFSDFEEWLTDIAVGPKNTFTYTDEDSNNHTVRLMDSENPLRKIGPNQYAGTIRLRKEIT